MRFYKTKYELPLFNWLMIQESGYDLKYISKTPEKVKNKHKKELNRHYMEILYSLNDVNSSILYHYIVWQAHLVQLKASLMIEKKPVIHGLEENFREYLQYLQKNYRQFEFKEYYFNPDYHEFYEKITADVKEFKVKKDIKRIFLDLSNIKFYDFVEYYVYIKNHELINKYEIIKALLHTDVFKNEFILERTVKFNNLIDVDIHLYDVYESDGRYYEYQYKRLELFNMYDLQSENRSEFSPFDQVAAISDIIGYQIDSKKTSLAEWESIQTRATRKIEKSNKPSEA